MADDGGPRPLRDIFANAAMVALLNNPKFDWDLTSDHTPEENLARRCYAIADAMLIERATDRSLEPDSPLWGEEKTE